MPRKMHKSLHDCLSKLKKPAGPQFSASNALSWSINRMMAGCKYPKTLSLDIDADQTKSHRSSERGHAATLSDIDRFLFENFSSLYQKDDDDDDSSSDNDDKKKKPEEEEKEKEDEGDSPLLNIFSSGRFFTTPGSSSSLMEDARASLTASSSASSSGYATSILDFSSSSRKEMKEILPPPGCIAVLMNSRNQYVDFRLSMQEMIEARLCRHERVDWDFMEDLLFCYLNLNHKDSHKHILQAFVDLIAILRPNAADKAPASGRGSSAGVGGERRRRC